VSCSSAELRAGLAQLELLLDNLAIKGEGLRFAANGLGGPGAIATPELTETLAHGVLPLIGVSTRLTARMGISLRCCVRLGRSQFNSAELTSR
jgi:hypothetical protein